MMRSDIAGSIHPAPRLAVLLWALSAGLSLFFGARPAQATPFAYVANELSNDVSVIDTAANKVVATVPVGNGPLGIAITPDGKRAYVANLLGPGSDDGSFAVSVIDTTSNEVLATVPVARAPFGVAIAPDGKNAYVAVGSHNVSVIDTAINKVVVTVRVEESPHFVAISPDGKNAYVTNQLAKTLSVLDTAGKRVAATVPAGQFPTGIATTPDGRRLYVTNVGDNTVSVFDTASNSLVATIPVGNDPIAVAVTPDGKRAYVTNGTDGNTVSVIDTASNTVVATIPVGTTPAAVAISPDSARAYVTNTGDTPGTVSVIDTDANTVVATIIVGDGPSGIAIMPQLVDLAFDSSSLRLRVRSGEETIPDLFTLDASFTLGSASNGINPLAELVTLRVGSFTMTVPPGSFVGRRFGPFHFEGVTDGVQFEAEIEPTGPKRYAFHANAYNAKIGGAAEPVPITLTIGDDSGVTAVNARTH